MEGIYEDDMHYYHSWKARLTVVENGLSYIWDWRWRKSDDEDSGSLCRWRKLRGRKLQLAQPTRTVLHAENNRRIYIDKMTDADLVICRRPKSRVARRIVVNFGRADVYDV